MTDERALGVMTPALPSRATGEAKPLTPLPTAGVDPATLPKVKKKRRGPYKVAPGLKRKRRKKVMKKNYPKRLTRGKGKLPPATMSIPPNRPLEAKNWLHALLLVVGTMSKAEVQAFTGAMTMLEDMAGPARKRVIEALGKVYA
jgi:hypothetical protein